MVPGSQGTVDQAGLYTPPAPQPAFDYVDVVNATNAGTPTCPSVTAQAAIHHGASVPGEPKDAAISADGTTVTWTAPAADGSAIQEYVVTVLNDPGDPAGAQTVLGTAPGTATSMAIPADRIAQIEQDGAGVEVTAVNARGQGPTSVTSPPAPASNPLPLLTSSTGIAGGGTINVTPDIVNLGRNDATNVTYQLTYPATFTNPTAPSSCTIDGTNRTITCNTGAIPASTHQITPLISFVLGQFTQGTGYPVRITRLAASPYPSDPNNGTSILTCTADSSLNVTCQ